MLRDVEQNFHYIQLITGVSLVDTINTKLGLGSISSDYLTVHALKSRRKTPFGVSPGTAAASMWGPSSPDTANNCEFLAFITAPNSASNSHPMSQTSERRANGIDFGFVESLLSLAMLGEITNTLEACEWQPMMTRLLAISMHTPFGLPFGSAVF